MAELRAISATYVDVETHVVFVHGLSGHIEKTWTSKGDKGLVLWPNWLAEDLSGVGLWLVGYPAAKTNWGGYGMPLADRADNVLARLIAEPRLAHGTIAFVAHSLGGLLVEQLIRNADRDAGGNRRTEEFVSRVRRVAFLGTPHRGAQLANTAKALSFLLRPSASTRDLLLGDPQLRHLNFWYRAYCRKNRIENLVLSEGRPERLLCFNLPDVVSADSADAGLPELPIRVDATHISICKPTTRASDVYAHVRDFIAKPQGSPPEVSRIVEALDKTTNQLEVLTEGIQGRNEAIDELARRVAQITPGVLADTTLVDAEVTRLTELLRIRRLFPTFKAADEARNLVTNLLEGSLTQATAGVKSEALAWCARLLSAAEPELAQRALDAIVGPATELTEIARAFVLAKRGRLNDALGALAAIAKPAGSGAAYICVLQADGFKKASEWLWEAGLTLNDIDSDAKFFCINSALANGDWASAFKSASELTEGDFERSPGLVIAAADVYLVQAAPEELRMFLLQYLPFDTANFPLRSEPEYINHRRTAATLYERARDLAEGLQLHAVIGHLDDRRLWLQLLDPETASDARRDLAESIKDPTVLLRRLNLALQFGVKIDLAQVEREVDRQTALSGGLSHAAAAARFTLAFTQKSRLDAAVYVERHRAQLLQHLDWKAVYLFEIEMLASSGQTAQAEVRVQEALARGLTEDEENHLRRQLAEAAGSDPITERLAAYAKSRSIADLRILVDVYEEKKNWEKVVEYGSTLLDRTGDLADARRYIFALYQRRRLDELLAVLEVYPGIEARYEALRLLRAQTLYELGRLDEARTTLESIRQKGDSAPARQLLISLAVTSGDWESLQSFVEGEWNARDERTATEILRAGQIAQLIGVARGASLLREAAQRAPDNPSILLGCYQAASASGLDNRLEIHKWIERAAELSELRADGPVQRMSIEDLLERSPGWQKREADTWNGLAMGDIPIFAAGQLVNRSLISLFLVPAISNLSEIDARRRPFVYGFSGARSTGAVNPQTIAMDPTALMTAELLGVLDLCIDTFDKVIIPHSTLGWLIEEKSRILFHQPSRVSTAHELRRMIAAGHLQGFEGRALPPESLVQEIGESLASLLAEASSMDHTDKRQRLVVRGGPIHKVSTFMKDEADLASYEPYLCSSVDVVDKLVQEGVLTALEAEQARAALHVRERPWPARAEIVSGAVLYLDDVTVSHLAFLGLLPKLHRANITAVVCRSEIEEADALIAHDARGADVAAIVERMRANLREGLERGKVRLGRAVGVDVTEGPVGIMAHPTVAMLQLISEADAGVVDDRFVNQHASIAGEESDKPVLTTLDILNALHCRGAMSAQGRQEARTTLRRANFALMPLDWSEVSSLVSAAPVLNGVLVETAELRAIRECILRLRMSDVVQLPKELPWLNGMLGACVLALKEQWKDGVDEALAAPRSDWLMALGDVRGWTHRLDEDAQHLLARYRNWLAHLMVLPVAQPEPVRLAYWRWFKLRVLGPAQNEDPETHAFLVEQSKAFVARSVEVLANRRESVDE